MMYGLPISLILHGSIIFAGLFVFSKNIPPVAEGKIIPVEIISVAEETNISAAIKAKTPEQIKEAEEPLELETPLENAQEKGPEDQLKQAEPLPVKTAEAALPTPLDDKIDQETEEVPDEEGEDAPEAPAFNLNDIASLIDHSRQSQPEKNQQVALESEKNRYAFAKVARAGAGLGTKLTSSEVDALRSRMYQCWRISADAVNPEELHVRVRVLLNENGTVKDASLLDKVRINTSRNEYLKIAAQRALRAVSKCAPYDFLPAEKYGVWKDMELSFRPDV